MLLLASVPLFLLATAGTTRATTATPTAEEVCTPRPDPLVFNVTIAPQEPKVGDEVRISVGVGEVDGLLFGNPSIGLNGAALLFGRDPPPFFHEGLGTAGPVIFTLHAQLGGTAELTVQVNYETECACGTVCFFRRTVFSTPFSVTVAGPTATPTAVCIPPLCGAEEVLACPDTCPGGCGTICATQTPTPCATPACRNDETFFCPSSCLGSCGLSCATRTPTAIPIPECPGDCNGDGRVDISELIRGVRVAFGADDDDQCLVAFDREGSGNLTVDEVIAAVNRALVGCDGGIIDPRSLACRNSGGIPSPEYCCDGYGDFRDTCTVGTCGTCPFDDSARHRVTACACGVDRCFDGTECLLYETRTPTHTLDVRSPTPTPFPDDSVLPCISTGGTPSSRLCCLAAQKFPNTCLIDTCACPRNVSEYVQVCDCGPSRCYDALKGGCTDPELTEP